VGSEGSEGGEKRVVTGAAIARIRVMGEIAVKISSNFDIRWFRIAVEHEQAAIEARARAVAAPDGSTEMAEAFDDELRAAMVAVAAAAFAIDALYEKVTAMLESSARPCFSQGAKRPGRIVETFKVALDLGKRAAAWQSEIPRLFELRDDEVHFRASVNPSEPHPTGKSNVSRENLIYTCEEATRAVDLALEVLTAAYSSPRKQHEELAKWTESAAHVPDMLTTERERYRR
jgi:hypothetical protein